MLSSSEVAVRVACVCVGGGSNFLKGECSACETAHTCVRMSSGGAGPGFCPADGELAPRSQQSKEDRHPSSREGRAGANPRGAVASARPRPGSDGGRGPGPRGSPGGGLAPGYRCFREMQTRFCQTHQHSRSQKPEFVCQVRVQHYIPVVFRNGSRPHRENQTLLQRFDGADSSETGSDQHQRPCRGDTRSSHPASPSPF